jgi:hypothetical protein
MTGPNKSDKSTNYGGKMKKLSVWGILIGGVVDIVSTNILAFPLIMYIIFTHPELMRMSTSAATTALTQVLQGDWLLFGTQFLLGVFCSVLGGYVAALIAKHDELLNGALSAYLCVAFGIYGVVTKIGTESIFLIVLGFILSPALGLLGGHLRLLQVRSKQAKALAGAAS